MATLAQSVATDRPVQPDSSLNAVIAAVLDFSQRMADLLGGSIDLAGVRLSLRAQSELRRDRQQALLEGVSLLRQQGNRIGRGTADVLAASIRTRLTGGIDPLGASASENDALDHRLLLAKLSAGLRECIDPGRLTRLHALLRTASGRDWPDAARQPVSPESLVMALDACVAELGASPAARGFLLEHLCATLHRTIDASYAMLVERIPAIDRAGPPSGDLPAFVHAFIDGQGAAASALARTGGVCGDNNATGDFAWSLQPKQASELPRLRAMLPGLLVSLRRSLRGAGIPPIERERFLAELVDHYVRLVARALRASGASNLSLVAGSGLR